MNETAVSVCPVCLNRVHARKYLREGTVYLEKVCPEHGVFTVPIWRGEPEYDSWHLEPADVSLRCVATEKARGCPYDCGICPEHLQNVCCVLLEVTQRCNLGCPVCFASAGGDSAGDLSMEEIAGMFDFLLESGGGYNIQLSGGEPTVRDDLPEIIRLGKSKGFDFFQLNTNGLRLAHDADYAQSLRDAGLDCVFLQFDALTEAPYVTLRGRPLLEQKLACIENCAKAELGVVLVPTLAASVNDDQLGAILDFAVERLPFVRGVHFQPISYFGRYPVELADRLTLPELMRSIERQTGGRMKASDFSPAAAENSCCEFHGSFVLGPGGELTAVRSASCCCGDASRPREYVAKQWGAPLKSSVSLRNVKPLGFDEFLTRTRQYTLAVSAMAFQDCYTLELERLRQCHICVVTRDRRLIPFCAYNLTSLGGDTLYRGRI